MRPLILLAAFAAAILCASDAGAQCHVIQRAVYAPIVYQPVIPIAVATYSPVAVVSVPQYSVGYQPQQMPDNSQNALLEEIRALRAAVQQLSVAGPGKTFGLSALSKGETLLVNRCSICHDETVAAAKGKGHVLFKGGRFLDDEKTNNAGRVIAEIDADRMPRSGPKFTPLEKYESLKHLTVRDESAPAPQPMSPADPNKK